MPGKDSPQLANREALMTAVEAALSELEALCGRLERGLMARRWEDVNSAIADSRRLTHALANAMDDAISVRDAAINEQIEMRIRYVYAIRENQMMRLRQYHDAVAERLRMLSRWKSVIRSMAASRRASRRGLLDLMT